MQKSNNYFPRSFITLLVRSLTSNAGETVFLLPSGGFSLKRRIVYVLDNVQNLLYPALKVHDGSVRSCRGHFSRRPAKSLCFPASVFASVNFCFFTKCCKLVITQSWQRRRRKRKDSADLGTGSIWTHRVTFHACCHWSFQSLLGCASRGRSHFQSSPVQFLLAGKWEHVVQNQLSQLAARLLVSKFLQLLCQLELFFILPLCICGRCAIYFIGFRSAG